VKARTSVRAFLLLKSGTVCRDYYCIKSFINKRLRADSPNPCAARISSTNWYVWDDTDWIGASPSDPLLLDGSNILVLADGFLRGRAQRRPNDRGGNDIYQSGKLGLAQTTTVYTPPNDDSQIYATLYTLINGQWYYNSYRYQSGRSSRGTEGAEVTVSSFKLR